MRIDCELNVDVDLARFLLWRGVVRSCRVCSLHSLLGGASLPAMNATKAWALAGKKKVPNNPE
jgi:hypothetical protein